MIRIAPRSRLCHATRSRSSPLRNSIAIFALVLVLLPCSLASSALAASLNLGSGLGLGPGPSVLAAAPLLDPTSVFSEKSFSNLIHLQTISRQFGKSASLPTDPRALADASTTISTKIQTPLTRDCRLDQSCALTSVQFVEYKKLFRFSGEAPKLAAHFTDTRFVISTQSLNDLESFGVVQFIHGCMFRSRLVNGTVQKDLSISRDEFGKVVPFQHKTWEIDNDNDDPLISAQVGYGRFALLRWNQNPKNIESEGAAYYANKKPTHATVFLSDLPSAGALMPTLDVADNSTLQFRTCIFKIGDLPIHTDPQGRNVDANKALWCAEWTHSYVWNFQTQQMDEPKGIDPICDAN